MAMAQAEACDPPASPQHAWFSECDLFDGDREPPDQPRYLVQLNGIVVLDRQRQTGETLIIAHDGHFARDDRRNPSQEISLGIWHESPQRNPAHEKGRGRISPFGVCERQPLMHKAVSGRVIFVKRPPGLERLGAISGGVRNSG
jgi:hypothetical protein